MEDIALADSERKVDSLRQKISELHRKNSACLYNEELAFLSSELDQILVEVFSDSAR